VRPLSDRFADYHGLELQTVKVGHFRKWPVAHLHGAEKRWDSGAAGAFEKQHEAELQSDRNNGLC